jgi:hypothetical protein
MQVQRRSRLFLTSLEPFSGQALVATVHCAHALKLRYGLEQTEHDAQRG